MSHAPEWPELYVCDGCNAVYAGHHASEGQHHYEPPAECAACGNEAFVEIQRLSHP